MKVMTKLIDTAHESKYIMGDEPELITILQSNMTMWDLFGQSDFFGQRGKVWTTLSWKQNTDERRVFWCSDVRITSDWK